MTLLVLHAISTAGQQTNQFRCQRQLGGFTTSPSRPCTTTGSFFAVRIRSKSRRRFSYTAKEQTTDVAIFDMHSSIEQAKGAREPHQLAEICLQYNIRHVNIIGVRRWHALHIAKAIREMCPVPYHRWLRVCISRE
jgi:hypothetical protein